MESRAPAFRHAWILAILLLPAAPAQEGERIRLKVQLPKNATVRFRATSTQTQTVSLGEMEMETRMETSVEAVLKVLDVLDGGALDAELLFGAVRGKMETPMMGELKFDSSRPAAEEDNPMAAIMARAVTALSGKRLRMRLHPDGDVTAITGVEEVIKAALGEERAGPGIRRMIGDQFTPEGIRHQVREFLARLPTEEVGIGATWPERSEQPLLGKVLVMQATHTLERIEDESAVASFQGTLRQEEQKKPGAPGKPEEDEEERMALDFLQKASASDGTIKGTLNISRKDGLPLSRTASRSMKLSLPNPMGGEEGMEVQLAMGTRLERLSEPSAGEEAGRGGKAGGDKDR